eukprot:Pompholyxophrys_punicea_v1_NODE_103_length_3477_cov_5.215371.p1 type:complete len:260 gc:universal NODE_103_length_3477_cov_5.215371:301-1080(+)
MKVAVIIVAFFSSIVSGLDVPTQFLRRPDGVDLDRKSGAIMASAPDRRVQSACGSSSISQIQATVSQIGALTTDPTTQTYVATVQNILSTASANPTPSGGFFNGVFSGVKTKRKISAYKSTDPIGQMAQVNPNDAQAFNTLLTPIIATIQGIINEIIPLVTGIISTILGLINQIINMIMGIVNTLVNLVISIINSVIQPITGITITGTTNYILSLIESIIHSIFGLATSASTFSCAFDTVLSSIPPVLAAYAEVAAGFP